MVTRSVWTTILLLVLMGVVKAHLHFLRLVILAAAGLAGLYMVHLLAQDWTKIRPNRPNLSSASNFLQSALMRISKRSIPDDMFDEKLNELPTMNEALLQDPLGCARKLVCTLATRPRTKLTTEERNILAMVRTGRDSGSRHFEEAALLGARSRRESACNQRFDKCFFSTRQLVKILRNF